MANFVFIAEMASFQNGDSPFYIKRISLTPVHSGQLVSFTYAIDFFLEHSDSAFHTFATWNIHGITLDEPGIPYDLSGDTILTALKHHIFQPSRVFYKPAPQILLVTKGPHEICLLEKLILPMDISSNLIIAIKH